MGATLTAALERGSEEADASLEFVSTAHTVRPGSTDSLVVGVADVVMFLYQAFVDAGDVETWRAGDRVRRATWQRLRHETANVHVALGSVWDDLERRKRDDSDWLYRSATHMAEKVVEDLAASRLTGQ